MNTVIALGLIALGMGVDALYQWKIRVAECDAYKTGYEQGKKEGRVRLEAPPAVNPLWKPGDEIKPPSMAAPVAMPDNFEEHMRKHGRATARVK